MTPADDEAFRSRVDDALARFAAAKQEQLEVISKDLVPFVDAASDFVAGGKRLRPLFCRAGWLIAGGDPADPAFDDAAASLEWLQGSALAHDDVMDDSDTRRGRPSLHRVFEQRHREEQMRGDSANHGRAVAILLGDLMLSWVDEQFQSSRLPRLEDARPWLDQCKTEVTAGQYLDVLAQARGTTDAAEAMTVVRYKSAKYTVERPLHIGAALAGANDQLMKQLTAVALPLGEAFQLRDDILGVYGDPAATGKPAGDDLREGKRTVLVARAAERGTEADRSSIEALLGTSTGIAELSDLIRRTGALEAVEQDIDRLESDVERALLELPESARAILKPLALSATRRDR